MASPLVARAAAFAKAAHGGIDHRRKGTGEAYTNHLARVAALVARAGGDAEMIAAAWLHDVVEDTPTSLDEIRLHFGTGVAALVEALTDAPRSAGNRAQRKALDRARLDGSGARAQTIKLADIIDNVPDICVHDPGFAPRYLRECRDLLAVLQDGDAQLRARARQCLRTCQARLRRNREGKREPSSTV